MTPKVKYVEKGKRQSEVESRRKRKKNKSSKKNYENLGEQNYFLKSQELKLKKELTFEKNNYDPKENAKRFFQEI